tara:strand:- start:5142 stop:5405 length:264 start_codon:yes stop_codon:yes gene_type:complete
MKNEEAKKYCLEVIGMSESDFRKAEWDDIDIDGIEEGDWIHDYMSYGECGDEGEMKTAIELAKDHKFWNNPDNTEAYLDFHFSNNIL